MEWWNSGMVESLKQANKMDEKKVSPFNGKTFFSSILFACFKLCLSEM